MRSILLSLFSLVLRPRLTSELVVLARLA